MIRTQSLRRSRFALPQIILSVPLLQRWPAIFPINGTVCGVDHLAVWHAELFSAARPLRRVLNKSTERRHEFYAELVIDILGGRTHCRGVGVIWTRRRRNADSLGLICRVPDLFSHQPGSRSPCATSLNCARWRQSKRPKRSLTPTRKEERKHETHNRHRHRADRSFDPILWLSGN